MKSYRKTCVLIFLLLTSKWVIAQGTFQLSDWPEVDTALKPMILKAIIEQASVNNVMLKLPIPFYQEQLDILASWSKQHNHRDYLALPVAQNLATLAVIHCDWNNGVSPYEFAQKYLGAAQLENLSRLYAKPIDRLKNNCIELVDKGGIK